MTIRIPHTVLTKRLYTVPFSAFMTPPRLLNEQNKTRKNKAFIKVLCTAIYLAHLLLTGTYYTAYAHVKSFTVTDKSQKSK